MRWYARVREVGAGDESGGETVVLAHGYGLNQASWASLLPNLSQTNKVLLFDWDFTGGGGPEEDGRYTFERFADELIALMDEREVRGAVLVGHSMSAMAACIASARRPDLFAHLLLLCASPRYINSPEEGYVGGFDEAAIHGMLHVIATDFHAWVDAFLPNAAGDATLLPLLGDSFHAMRPDVALRLARMIFLGDQRRVLAAVTVPCTIVQVSGDFAAPPVVAEYMRRSMTRAAAVDVEIVDSVGHFPQLAAPQQLLRVLHAVLRRLRKAGEEEEAEHASDEEVDGGIDVTT